MPTVLIADDSPTQLAVLQRPLEERGIQVLTAGSGDEAYAIAEACRPDLIFMDVIMPAMNGFQATRRISRSRNTAHIPIVIVTSKGQKSDKIWGLRQGAVAYLIKPVEATELIQITEKLLGARTTNRTFAHRRYAPTGHSQ